MGISGFLVVFMVIINYNMAQRRDSTTSIMYRGLEKPINLESLAERFLMDISITHSGHTVKTYGQILRVFIEALPVLISHITSEHIESHILCLARSHTASTANLHLAAIKSFYNWLTNHYGVANPAHKVRRLVVLPPKQRILQPEEYNCICTHLKDHRADCLRFLCNTGLRATEFLELTPANIAEDFIHIIGKGRKYRSIPINRIVKEIVGQHPRLEFRHSKNRLWLWRLCRSVADDLKLAPFSPHACRHYFSNELWRRGCPVHTISKLLGHANSQVTETVYLQWSEQDLRGVTEILLDK